MRILVVDDRLENRIILQTKMKAAGYEVEAAANGTEALEKLRVKKFDLVITDLMMPEMDGFRLTRTIKTDDALRSIPVLVFTATYLDAEDEALALNQGADAFVRKPAPDKELFGSVNSLLSKAAAGELAPKQPTKEELAYLREYNDRLIQKLEQKLEEVEATHEELRQLNSSLEKRIAEATSELRRVNQDLEAFTYSVSHDLRAPLRGIDGFLTAVLSDDLSEQERQEFLQRAAHLAKNGQKLITDLLEYAKLSGAELPLQKVQLGVAVNEALALLAPEERSQAMISIGPITSMVFAHEATLIQVVYNLISNALKFRKPDQRPAVSVEQTEKGDFIRLSIRDEGIGIAPEYQKKIFAVFERLHDSTTYPGTGVGLAIVQRGVQKMGGKLGLESAPGQGSTFWIELKRAA